MDKEFSEGAYQSIVGGKLAKFYALNEDEHEEIANSC